MFSITNWIKNSFFADKENWLLWVPVFFAGGIIFYFYFPHNSYFLPAFLLASSLALIIFFKEQSQQLLIIALALFLSGFLWAKFYSEKIAYSPKIKYQFYATIIGQITDIKTYHSQFLKRDAYKITLKNVEIYQPKILKGDILPKEKQRKKRRKSNKKLTKKYNKTIVKTYLNINGYQEIDRHFLAKNYKIRNQNWHNGQFKNPPKKIALNVNTKLGNAKIGDKIQIRAVLKPFKKDVFGDNSWEFYNYFQGITATGFAASDLKILSSSPNKDFMQKINLLRHKIAAKILDENHPQTSAIAVALMVGIRDFIPKDIMENIRNSGLAHLIAISGLHFGLAAGIFFFSIRFLLSCNQFLTLNYNIKKIAAFFAIFAGFAYLLLAGWPIPAMRAFIATSLIFTAIILDLKADAMRFCALGALTILILNPNAIFSASFQLSFAAILALINLADFTKKYHQNNFDSSILQKFILYFLAIIFSSIAATIATTPFIIYHFNSFVSYGILANLIAIPLTTFIIMPLGFLAILLMPLGLENLPLYLVQLAISQIIEIANVVSSLPGSQINIKNISLISFALIIIGGLWLLLWQKNWRFLGLPIIVLGAYFAYQTPIPTILVDKEKKMAAFYYNQKLIFIKPTKSKQAKIWAKKLGLDRFYDVNNLNEEEQKQLNLHCSKTFCKFNLNNQKILVLKGRNKITDICPQAGEKRYDIVININQKYRFPCLTTKSAKIYTKNIKKI